MADAPRNITDVEPARSAGPSLPVETTSGAAEEGYRPLSLLAVAGFALGVLYALAVSLGGLALLASRKPIGLVVFLVLVFLGSAAVAVMRRERRPGRILGIAGLSVAGVTTLLSLGSLVMYSSSNPWLLPGWMWLVPVASVLLCWMARSQIRAAEGTLEGNRLANWGLVLSLFFAINYGAYQASNIVAVRSQANRYAREFLGAIEKDQLLDAFILSLSQGERPTSGSDPRSFVEAAYNASVRAGETGPYTTFCTSDYVRNIVNAGGEVTIENTAVQAEFNRGGYEVELLYRITTPLARFEIAVWLFGIEVSGRGRQWRVVLDRTGMVNDRPMVVTDAGKLYEGQVAIGARFMNAWKDAVITGRYDAAYLMTLPPDERKRLWPAFLLGSPAGRSVLGLGAVPVSPPPADYQAYLAGRKAFVAGSFLNDGQFWADKRFKPEMLGLFRAAIASGEPLGQIEWESLSVRFPRRRVEGNRVRLGYLVRTTLNAGREKYIVDGEMVVEAEQLGGHLDLNTLRLVEYRLDHGQTMPKAQKGPQGGRR